MRGRGARPRRAVLPEGRNIQLGAHHGGEHSGLLGGLIRSGAAQVGGAVRGHGEEGDSGGIGFREGRVKIGDGGAGRGDHSNREGLCGEHLTAGQPEGEEASAALIDSHVGGDQAGARRCSCRVGEGRIARTGADDHMAHPATDQRPDNIAGVRGGRVRGRGPVRCGRCGGG